ncbi:MAG: DUF2752 domain-containing protein [Actinomycetota bacterium]|nr:DUF2752 domain-containing protein [Actinomycetota bacterium]
MARTDPAPVPDHRDAGARGRALVVVGVGAASLAALLVRLHATRGYDVAPVPLCPFHAVTGLWCPVCGSLRAVASLTRLDLAGALSSNLLVTALLPLLVVAAIGPAVGAVTGRPLRAPTIGNRGWVVLGVAFGVFTIWRNLPALPLGSWLAP